MSRIGKSIETENRLVVSKAGGGEVRSDFFPFWNKENALNLGVVIDGHHCEYITKNIKRKNFMACELYLIKDLKNVYSLLQ